MAESDADAFVFFGATGDLAYEQILCAEDVGSGRGGTPGACRRRLEPADLTAGAFEGKRRPGNAQILIRHTGAIPPQST
jgi:hypothetical protein